MLLADRDIKKIITEGKVVIKPLPDYAVCLGSCSLDLKLGNVFRVYNYNSVGVIDPYDSQIMEKLTSVENVKKGEAFILQPGEFALAITQEYIELPSDIAGRLEGRSSIGRLGVVIHSTASNIDAGFRGQITLELANMGRIPVKLYPGMRICSLSFETLSRPAEIPYYQKKTAKYSGQKHPESSKLASEIPH